MLADVERGRRSGLDRALGELFGRHPDHLFGRLGLALDAALAGRTSHALTALEALSRDRRAFYDLDGEVTFKQAQILGLAGLPEPGLTTLKQAVAAGFVCADCFERSSMLAEVRKLPGYRAVVEHARQRHDAFGRMFGVSRVRSGDSP